MKNIITSITLLASCLSVLANAQASEYIRHLLMLPDYHGKVTYSVLLPQAEDPVTYEIDMHSTFMPADTLSPCRYLIEWIMEREDADNISKGFSAYLDGAHYRYRDNRLQEYHWSWDSLPFIMANGGVQGSAQFADVLPQFVGREIDRLVADSNFVHVWSPDTISDGRHVAMLTGQLLYHGYVSKEATYIFEPATMMPVSIELENNPGSISEQTVTIKYTLNDSEAFPIAGENDLIERYPIVFEKYRESNFRVENLPGTQLPTFSCPAGKERYSYNRGDSFDTPVVIAILDDNGGNIVDTIEQLRTACDASPRPFDIIFAFTTTDSEHAAELTGRCRQGERVLTSAKTLARDCGVSSFPTLLYVGRNGRVADVTLGYNKELSSVVIQKATLNF